jgi:signal transduction histidine kinase/ActR/RegA family two-component response regulator
MEAERPERPDVSVPAHRKPPARLPAVSPEERAHLLSSATTLLASSLDIETTLGQLARLAVPVLADWCVVDLLEDDGWIRRLAVAHAEPADDELARRLEGRIPFDRDAPRGPARVIATGRTEILAEASDGSVLALGNDPAHLARLRELAVSAVICVPLITRGRTLGALSLLNSTRSGRGSHPTDVAIARVIAQRAAAAVEHALLFQAEQRARQSAEEAAGRMARLQSITAALLEALTPSDVSAVIVEQGMAALGASTGAVALVTEDGAQLVVVSAVGYAGQLVEPGRRIPLAAPTPLADAIRTGEPVFLASAAEREARYPEFARRAAAHEAGATVPLTVRGRPVGVLGLGFAAPHEFGNDERAFMLALGRQCALALERARLYEGQRHARAEAEAANRAKDQFLATLSHELRTPLTAMLGWVRVLRAGGLDPLTVARALATIERSVKAQAQLIDDLLDVSRIIAGKLRLETQLLDFKTVVEAALEGARPAAEAKRIRLDAALEPGLVALSGDPGRLQQIVANLLGNAVKFTPDGGKVEVVLARRDADVELRVRDTGQGIRPEFLPHVFDAFRQEDSAASRAHTGLGLGLAIVRHLVERHGGTVTAESPGEGQGATFVVRLPVPAILRSPAGPSGGGEERPEPQARTLEGLRVLVVDDQADALELVSTILSRAGALVTPAASAREARAAFDAARPDVLLCDIGMPEETGYALIRDVRAREPEQGGAVPAMALTAYASVDDRERALSAGFHLHVAKPVDPAQLVRMVAALARGDAETGRPG